jgi:hypothetical protein
MIRPDVRLATSEFCHEGRDFGQIAYGRTVPSMDVYPEYRATRNMTLVPNPIPAEETARAASVKFSFP